MEIKGNQHATIVLFRVLDPCTGVVLHRDTRSASHPQSSQAVMSGRRCGGGHIDSSLL